ncbi:YchJ family protein [Brachybacterium timonense]|uniref:YchJ family protein n=1 Tax=Brachybacterium timonense TaxID=2050896 RepID=UPI000D0B6ECD|nr:YchJ family metal-binding protein [Brachybacterium timonense]
MPALTAHTRPDDSARCPCGTGDVYGDCCGPLLSQQRHAATAEQLMRSRFTAFATGDVDHALRSWHPRTSPSWRELDTSLADGTRWLRLDVLRSEQGGPFDQEGVVEFRAHAKTAQGRRVLHEVSRFERVDGRWLYVSGEVVTGA